MNFIVLLFLGALTGYCQGLNCYTCAKGTIPEYALPEHDGCGDPFSAFNATESSESNKYCMKITLGSNVARTGIQECIGVNTFGQGTSCCETDLCNSATSLSVGLLAIVFMMANYVLSH